MHMKCEIPSDMGRHIACYCYCTMYIRAYEEKVVRALSKPCAMCQFNTSGSHFSELMQHRAHQLQTRRRQHPTAAVEQRGKTTRKTIIIVPIELPGRETSFVYRPKWLTASDFIYIYVLVVNTESQ